MPGFEEIFDRIKVATNTRTQVELAEVLDIRQSSISDAKRRDSVPSDWYLKLFEKYGLNPDWLKSGLGPMYLKSEQGYEP
ncbi:MAG: helix-turn-helix domain containing protein, partial [Desulfovibrio sp.]|nr:helix-turn-helix domain containing protein [Desulfovibrio sp.]